MKKSMSDSHSSDNENTFNFNLELDMTNNKKERTGENFFRKEYNFEDFQNQGDEKTFKSEKTEYRKNQNTS